MRRPDRYAALARWYDAATTLPLRRARAELARLCRERGYAALLDIGCGTGLLAFELHRRGFSVTGVDVSPSMLGVAAGRGRGRGVALVRGALPLPFAPASFDAAILSLVLHESEDEPCALLAEALRVAPVCLVLEWRMPERNLDLPVQPLVRAVERLAGRAHYERFRQFAGGGYLHGAAGRARARVTAEKPLMGGAMVLAEVVSL